MIKRLMKISAPLVACALVVAVSNVANAFPGSGSNCTGCHATGDGGMDITPDPIDIAIDSNGVITFDITSLPSVYNTIALNGTDLAALGLDATVGAPDNWTFNTSSGNWISDTIESTSSQSYTLNLGIGAAALENSYGIGAWLVGGSRGGSPKGASYDFSVNVIPEPTTLALLGMAGVGVCFLRRRR